MAGEEDANEMVEEDTEEVAEHEEEIRPTDAW